MKVQNAKLCCYEKCNEIVEITAEMCPSCLCTVFFPLSKALERYQADPGDSWDESRKLLECLS